MATVIATFNTVDEADVNDQALWNFLFLTINPNF